MVKTQHLLGLRSALEDAFIAAGLPVPSYTDATLNAQQTLIKAVHITELRAAVLTVARRVPIGTAIISNVDTTAIAAMAFADGRRAQFFGPKDSNGIPLGISKTTLTEPGGDTVRVTYDAHSVPVRAERSSGGSIDFEKVSADRVELHVNTSAGTVVLASQKADFAQTGRETIGKWFRPEDAKPFVNGLHKAGLIRLG
jgi:YD repeat-containing protein